MIKQYKVVQCSNCATLQSTSSAKTWKCIKCQTSKKISDSKIFFISDNPNDIVMFIKQKKEKENKYYKDFFTYK